VLVRRDAFERLPPIGLRPDLENEVRSIEVGCGEPKNALSPGTSAHRSVAGGTTSSRVAAGRLVGGSKARVVTHVAGQTETFARMGARRITNRAAI
jgi:hypothetical protein